MIKMPRILMTTALVAALSGAGLALAGDDDSDKRGAHKRDAYKSQNYAHMGAMSGEHWLKRLGDKLSLSDQQKQEIETIFTAGKAEGETLHEAARKAREAEMTAVGARADEGALRNAARASADARVDVMLHGFEIEKRVDKVLTAEQRSQLAELKKEHKAEMKANMEKRKEHMKDKKGQKKERKQNKQ